MNYLTSSSAPQLTRSTFGSRLARFFRPLGRSRAQVDPQQIADLAETVANQPRLRTWLLTIASEAPRVRRALLARGAKELRAIGHLDAADALEQMSDAAVLHAVTEALLRHSELEPLQPRQRTGRSARTRLGELNRRLEAGSQTACAA
jgi:hypothetical protein